MSNEHIYSYTSNPDGRPVGLDGSGSGSGYYEPTEYEKCQSDCPEYSDCLPVIVDLPQGVTLPNDGGNPIIRRGTKRTPGGTVPTETYIPDPDINDPKTQYRCEKFCLQPRPDSPPSSGSFPDPGSGGGPFPDLFECYECVNGQWVGKNKIPCVVPTVVKAGNPQAIDWPSGTNARTHKWDTSFTDCPSVKRIAQEGSDLDPWVVFVAPKCPVIPIDENVIPPSQTQSSIFDIIRSQTGTTSKPVTNEPIPQSSIFSLVRSQATPVATVASLSIQQQQSAPIPILMMAQNVGTQSDGGGGLKCSVAPVSYTSDLTYNTGYENSDEVVDNTTSYVKGYIDYTLSTDTITVIEPKL